jgi:hypothetical protein
LAKAGLSNHIAAIFTGGLIVELRRLDSIREGVRKSRKQRDLLHRFVALRNGDLESERLRIEQKKINFHRLKLQTEIEKQKFGLADTNRTPTPPRQIALNCQFCLAGQVLTLFFEVNCLWRSEIAGKNGWHGALSFVQGKA